MEEGRDGMDLDDEAIQESEAKEGTTELNKKLEQYSNLLNALLV